jgi:membrane-associated phospholipid phosphatase
MVASFDDAAAVWIATHRFALGTVEKLGAIWIACALVLGLVRRAGIARTIVLAVTTAIVTFAADGVSFGVKDLVSRTRPFVAHPQIHPLYVVHSSSFPAGHAATAFAGATFLTWVAPRLWPLFFSLATAIGFSRVYVGVHYPTDVVAGAAIGALVAGVAIVGVRLAARWKAAAAVAPQRRLVAAG